MNAENPSERIKSVTTQLINSQAGENCSMSLNKLDRMHPQCRVVELPDILDDNITSRGLV